MAYIEMKNSYKRYKSGQSEIIANNDISFEIEKGELAIILGSSGAGKSTVLNILGGMDTNDEGNVLIDGKDISTFNDKELTNYRRNDVGFVFQFYNLVPNLTAKENVELASEIVKDALDATGATVVIVTHNQALAPIADRVIHMHDAKIRDVVLNSNPQNIETLEY